MNCSPTIAIALLLLSLTAGMFLLYKTQKENLSIFFKMVSWFIIIVSLGSMICCSIRCLFRCHSMEQCEMGSGKCEMGEGMWGRGHHGGFNKRIMIFKDGDGECEMMGKGCCKEKMECCEAREGCAEGKTECCEKHSTHPCKMEGDKKGEMKMEIKKDTVVVKKK